MKKLLPTIVLLLFLSMSINSGYAENKKNNDTTNDTKYFGAKKGGFSLTVGIVPVVNFVGNMFNNTEDQDFSGFGSIQSSNFNGNILSASYFITNKLSLTAGVGFNVNHKKNFTYDDNDLEQSTNVTGSNELTLSIGANYLLRPGARLQPILGGGLMYGFVDKNFEKVDDKTSVNADFNHKTPSSIFGVMCNIGVEVFISRAVSLSALADLALTKTWNKTKVNDWDEQKTTLNSTQTKFATGKFGGNLGLNFYF